MYRIRVTHTDGKKRHTKIYGKINELRVAKEIVTSCITDLRPFGWTISAAAIIHLQEVEVNSFSLYHTPTGCRCKIEIIKND